ncbi:MAG TPA: hypothetical protein VNJ07_12445 [Chitinophagales bacterium]|nr:hypothetical protein [Chitinophagales bacterium]
MKNQQVIAKELTTKLTALLDKQRPTTVSKTSFSPPEVGYVAPAQ